MEMRTILIDFEVHKEIERRRHSFKETPNDVLRRNFGLPAIIPNNTEVEKETPGLAIRGTIIPNGTKLRGAYKGKQYYAEIEEEQILFNGKKFKSPSSAAMDITYVNTNGWFFWEYYDAADNEWKTLKILREKGKA
ncbi:MAG: DUF2924 domain-containing protein [Candidatus Marinimicrobia bacterium]|nr:DUF2924 domain-containing protein [Candidatus Neomarinimicrobiota bacterium]MDD5582544.1 DUF2924 domain-containing protein [Candidatus Neomarinimicrobiota bacterium]